MFVDFSYNKEQDAFFSLLYIIALSGKTAEGKGRNVFIARETLEESYVQIARSP